MKPIKYFLLLFFFSVTSLFAQDYQLFSPETKKLFTTYPDPTLAYSLAFDSVVGTGNDLIYYNFLGLNFEFYQSDTCMFWTGNICTQQNLPQWTGEKIEFSPPESYTFYNLLGEPLTFDFGIGADDTLVYYSDQVQKFLLTKIGTDSINLFGIEDSARFFRINHTDLQGNTIFSPLNDHEIIIGKNLGLVQFFQVDSFPEVLKPLRLMGLDNPAGGFYQLTNELLYDFQPGDEFQIQEYSNYVMPVPPEYEYNRYRHYTCLNKSFTPDSLIYEFRRHTLIVDSATEYTDTVRLAWLRSEIIKNIPFERFDGSFRKLSLENFNEHKLWKYTVNTTEGWQYCVEDNCWGIGDTGGPPGEWHLEYVIGLGIFKDLSFVTGPYGYTQSNQIVYFKKDGIPWGTLIVGINESPNFDEQITLKPVPANDQLTISSSVTINEVIICDVNGKTVLSPLFSGKDGVINISELKPGFYLACIFLENGVRITKKMVVGKK
jgi:hypothetical protein